MRSSLFIGPLYNIAYLFAFAPEHADNTITVLIDSKLMQHFDILYSKMENENVITKSRSDFV